MYDWPEVAARTDAFWRRVAAALAEDGIARSGGARRGRQDLAAAWARPRSAAGPELRAALCLGPLRRRGPGRPADLCRRGLRAGNLSLGADLPARARRLRWKRSAGESRRSTNTAASPAATHWPTRSSLSGDMFFGACRRHGCAPGLGARRGAGAGRHRGHRRGRLGAVRRARARGRMPGSRSRLDGRDAGACPSSPRAAHRDRGPALCRALAVGGRARQCRRACRSGSCRPPTGTTIRSARWRRASAACGLPPARRRSATPDPAARVYRNVTCCRHKRACSEILPVAQSRRGAARSDRAGAEECRCCPSRT